MLARRASSDSSEARKPKRLVSIRWVWSPLPADGLQQPMARSLRDRALGVPRRLLVLDKVHAVTTVTQYHAAPYPFGGFHLA